MARFQNAWTATEDDHIVQVKPELIKSAQKVVHVDSSCDQLIAKETHPILWQLLYNHEKRTGEPALINTSFNGMKNQ